MPTATPNSISLLHASAGGLMVRRVSQLVCGRDPQRGSKILLARKPNQSTTT